MSRNAKRFRSLVITVIAVAATNFAISYANTAKSTVKTDSSYQRAANPSVPPPPPVHSRVANPSVPPIP